jgi:YVTN family beta-propeller protein
MRFVKRSLLLILVATWTSSFAFAQTLLIGNKGEDTVSFVDLTTGQERARTRTGPMPHEIAVSPDGREAAIVAHGGTTIDIFDIRTARRTKQIDISPNAGPHGIVWLRSGNIVATAERSKSVVIADPRSGTVSSVPTNQLGSHMLAVSPDQGTAYVANILSGTVSIIDIRRQEKVGDIAVGGNPEGIAVTRDGKSLWVGDNSGARLRVIDIESRSTKVTLPTDSVAIRIAISPDGKTAVASNMMTGTLSLFDVKRRQALRSIRVSGDTKAMQVTVAFSRTGRRVFVAETGHDTIAEADLGSGRVVRRIAAGRNGDGLGVAP